MMNADNESKLIIVSLEGCHGCGKTALCAEFEAQGYSVLDEAFMDMPSYALHPQSLLMETSWVCSWFERVLRLASRVRKEKNPNFRKQVYIADRSPFSAVLYSSNGHLLEPVIRAQMQEVEEQTNVQFYTVHISVEPELLWSRIIDRLEREPERVRFNEHKRSWMDETLAFYNSFKWDLTINNDERSVPTIVDNISNLLVAQDANFRVVYERTKSLSCNSSVASTDSDYESVEEHELEAVPVSPKSVRSIIAFNNCDLDF
ncbi:P-loop containing nucleoside triphosphate hydrolase, partial [Globisporangium splendens]